MSPEYVSTHPQLTAAETLAPIRSRLDDAETVYTFPVLDDGRRVVGVVSLRDLMRADDAMPVGSLMKSHIRRREQRLRKSLPGGAQNPG
jgi:magnesium transporter